MGKLRYILTGILMFWGGILWAQAPVITTFSPTSGSYGTPVTITGTGFSASLFGNIVYFGNSRAVVDSCNSTTIYTKVPVGAQYKKIVVTTGGKSGWSKYLFKVVTPCAPAMYDGSFKTPVAIQVGGMGINTSLYPATPEIADIDNDNKLDVIAVNKTGAASSKVLVFKNQGTPGNAIATSTFKTPSKTYWSVSGGTATTPRAVDLDCDGFLDIMVPSGSNAIISVLKNMGITGTDTFAASASITTPSPLIVYSHAADFDGDGKPDIVALSQQATSYINVLKNNTTPGTITTANFTAIAQGPLALVGYAVYFDIDDIDGDGKLDIAVACSTASTVRVFRNTTTGTTITFAAPVDIVVPGGAQPSCVRLMDMDGDSKPDLCVPRIKVAPSAPDVLISIFRNINSTPGSITTGSFASAFNITVASNPMVIDLADMDGDLKPDVVCPNNLGNSFVVYKNSSTSGTLSFSYKYKVTTSVPTGEVTIGIRPAGACIGDLNGDNIPDFVVYNTGSGASPASVMAVEGQKPTVRISSVLLTPSCPGNQVGIVYTTTGAPYATGNKFVAYMSDSVGSFASPDSLGAKTGTSSDTLYVTIPSTATIGGSYRLMLNTTNPGVACVDTGYPIQIVAPPVISIFAGADTTINVGDSVQLQSGGGTSYTWNANLFLSDTTIGNPFAKPYFTQDFIVKGKFGYCSSYDTVRVNVTQNFNFCSVCTQEYPVHSGLVACYPLNGTGIDESGNGYHILFNNVTPTSDKAAAAGKAYAFTGSGSWLSRSPVVLDVNDSVTMMGWFYSANGTQSTPLIYVGNNGTGGGYGINLDNCSGAGGNKLNVLVGGSSICGGSSSQLGTGTWTHVALTKAGSNYAIFVNGTQVVSGTGTAATIAGGSFMIGGSPYTGQSFSGSIDEVRVFSRTLSQVEIQTFYSGTYKRFVQTIADKTICQGDSVNFIATGAATYSWTPGNGVGDIYSSNTWVKPVTTANTTTAINYIVTGSKTYCSDKDTVKITVDNYKNFANAGVDVGFCKTPAATANVQLGASFANTYFWTPNYNIIAGGQSSPVPKVAPDVDTFYVLRATRGVCVGYDTVKVKVDDYKNFANAGVDTFICMGNSLQLNASGGTGYTWTWLPNAAGVISNSEKFVPNPNATPTVNTTFTVAVKKGYCTETDQVDIRVDDFGNFLSIYNFPDTSLCIGRSSQLWAGGADTYKWSPSSTLSNDTLPNPIATPSSTTTYKVDVTKGGCISSGQVKVTVDNYKNFLNAAGDTAICPEDFAPLFASGASSYKWISEDSISFTSSLQYPYAGPFVTTKYYVYGYKGACIEKDSVIITVGSNSSSSVDAGKDTAICKDASVVLNGKGNGAFQWESTTGLLGGLSSTTDKTPVATPTITTKYILTIVDTVGVSCEIKDSVTVTVYPKPIAKITSPDPAVGATICEGDDKKLNALAGGLTYTYLWTPNYKIQTQFSRTPLVSPEVSTYYKVRVSDGRCADFDSIYVTVIPRPKVDLGPDLTICKTDSVIITPKFDAVSPIYNWSNNSTGQFIKVSPDRQTEYRLFIQDGTCLSIEDTVIVNVVPKAFASFEIDEIRGSSPFKVNFSNTSVGADAFYWYFGDTSGIIGRERDTSFTYVDTGFYMIVMRAENSLGNCSDQDTAYIRVDDFVTFYIPSGFSPNGDGKNDRFEVVTSGVSDFKGMVYNRWGEVVYRQESNKGTFSWDGTYKGTPVEDGIYFYFFDYSTFGDERESRSGTIYVVR